MTMKKVLAIAAVAILSGCSSAQNTPIVEFDSVQLGETNATTAEPAPTSGGSDPQPSSSESPSPTPTDSDDEAEYARDRYAEIDIEDQAGNGASVLIDEIHISGGNSFLVIYDRTGLVLSSTLVTTQSQPVQILLDTPLSSSQELEAVLYLDNGDGRFSLAEDSPILDEDGDLVHEDFDYTVVNNG